MRSFLRIRFLAAQLATASVALSTFAMPTHSQAQSEDSADASAGRGRILLVLPFDNRTLSGGPSIVQTASPSSNSTQQTNSQSLDWISEAAPGILNSRFTSAGFFPLTREDRLYALDRLGLPETFQPSRATALRIAQTLDADFILIGSYSASGSKLTLHSRIVDVGKLRISEEVTETGEISQLVPLLNSLAWRLTRMLDPGFGVAEETFRAADSKLRLDAFEQYVRGLTEHDSAERLRHLNKAVELSPNFTAGWLAIAKLQFANQQYEEAALAFGKVTRGDPDELEASFYRGLSLLLSGNYPRAEEAFAAVARQLPLPEVVNNEAVAVSRRGRDSSPLFRQAVAADPTDADYHFNLAVSLHRRGDKAQAIDELDEALKLHPADTEARDTAAAWKGNPPSTQAKADPAPSAAMQPTQSLEPLEPLERINRSFNGAAFRQAALMLDEVEAARLEALPKAERAARLSRAAHEKLDRGLLLEAEREYQAALASDDRSADAHAGLAVVRERAGDIDAARKEAHAALDRKPNLEAYMVLARLDLAANHLAEARDEAGEAVRLDQSSRPAKDLRRAIESRLESRSVSEPKSSVAKP